MGASYLHYRPRSHRRSRAGGQEDGPRTKYARTMVVAITGASAGIGRATALRFARDGASVAICARRADRLEPVAQEIARAGGAALSVVADVSQEADVVRFVDDAVRKFTSLDVMVCNAGFG